MNRMIYIYIIFLLFTCSSDRKYEKRFCIDPLRDALNEFLVDYSQRVLDDEAKWAMLHLDFLNTVVEKFFQTENCYELNYSIPKYGFGNYHNKFSKPIAYDYGLTGYDGDGFQDDEVIIKTSPNKRVEFVKEIKYRRTETGIPVSVCVSISDKNYRPMLFEIQYCYTLCDITNDLSYVYGDL